MMKKIIGTIAIVLGMILISNTAKAQGTGGYCVMRVFDCTKAVGAGSYYVNPSIIITYEDGGQEVIEIEHFSEKNEPEILKKITEQINYIKKKGYLLMTSTMTGEQGNMISEYVFMRQGTN